jgi:hypothetical protein
MAADLSRTPSSGIHVQACGDCHLLNFGGFATPERRVIFDINDFDETHPVPWEWDVKRLAASFVIAGRNNGLSARDCRDAAQAAVGSYRERTAELPQMPTLEQWYVSLDVFLGWTQGAKGRHFYIRQLRDVKIKPMVEIFNAENLQRFAGGCGWALARAHARSGHASLIAGYLGNRPVFDQAVARFAQAYADQNERDHDALVKAVRAGRVEAVLEH